MNQLSSTPGILHEGQASTYKPLEAWRRRVSFRTKRRLVAIIYNPLVQWWYWKGGLKKYDEPGELIFKDNLFWFCNGTWSHICGSDDIALEYFVRTFFPKWRGKKWRGGLTSKPL